MRNDLKVPEELLCDFMVHQLCKNYKYDIETAWKCYEYDYVRMMAFESLGNKQDNYLMKND